MHLKDSQQTKLVWFKKFLKNRKLSNNKFLNVGLLLLAGILLVAGFMTASNLIQQGFKVAKAEDISATAPVTGNYTGNLVLSPDNSIVYVSTGGYVQNNQDTVSKYDAATNTLISSITLTNSGIVMNPTGTKIYAFTGSNIKVIDTASFSITSTIPVANLNPGFLNADGSKLYVASTTDNLSVINALDNSVITTVTTSTIFQSTNTMPGYSINASLTGSGVFSLDGSRLYLAGTYNGAVIDTTTNAFLGYIPTTKDLTLSEDGKKIYSYDVATYDTIGVRVIDLATNKLDRVIFASKFVKVIPKDGKIFVIADNALTVYDAQSYSLLSSTPIINSTNNICSSGCAIKITPDGSKLYISTMVGGSITYIGNPVNNNVVIVPPSNILIVMDLKSFEININSNFSYSPSIQAFSKDGKKAYIQSVGNYKVVDTTLITTSDISSFSCTSPTNTLASTVTCNVITSTPVRGLAKFTVGLESCTAYFAAAGDTSATCTYTANNVQTSPLTIKPSFGSPSTSGTLSINGGASDVVISSSNIVSNSNCTPSGNVKIGSIFDCSFNLSGSSSNSYILLTSGVKIGVNGVVDKSDLCTLSGNGTANAKINCKNIQSKNGTPGNQNVLAYINGSSSGNNVGSINLTDGFLVNSTSDVVDSAPGDGYCGDATGRCTLRAAVMEANADYFKDKITIPTGIYQLTLPPTAGNNKGAIDGDLDVTTDIDFVGAGKDNTFIQSGSDATNGIDRVFHVFNTNVSFAGMTIRYGRVLDSTAKSAINGSTIAFPGNGGGIYYQKYQDFGADPENSIGVAGYNDDGYLPINADYSLKFPAKFDLTDVAISDNYAQNSGGGVYDSASSSKFTNVEIKNNVSGKYGGGVSRSTIYDRQTKSLVEQSYAASGSKLDLVGTTISNNKSVDGAGIYHDRGNKIILDENSKVLSNIASGNGGGIFNTECSFIGGVSTVTINGATINSNSAVNGGGIYNECGHVETLPGNITSKNPILQYNSASDKGSAWFGATDSLNELVKTLVYESNTQNPALTYNPGQLTSVMWLEGSSTTKISQSMFLGNWGRSVEFNNGAKVDIKETTISNNSGRGISYTNGSTTGSTTLKVVNSTISSNNSSGISFRSPSISFQGSHLTIANNLFGLLIDPQAMVALDNTIITGNTNKNCGDLSTNALTATVPGGLSRGKNLSNNTDCNNIFGFISNPNVQTYLGPLQFNGGPTVTIALLARSPAIDAGSGSLTYDGYPPSPNIDQRGFPRPFGLGYDIGAYEGQVLSPKANDDNLITNSNASADINVLSNDDGGANGIDNTSVTVVSQPSKGSLTDNGSGNFTYTPDASKFLTSGTDTFTYHFLDNLGTSSNTATVTINVIYNAPNIPPIANPDAITLSAFIPAVINVAANDTDPDGTLDLSSVTILAQPSSGNVSVNTTTGSPDLGKVTYTPNASSFASPYSDTFTYKIKDNAGAFSNQALVTIFYTPVAANDNATTNQEVQVVINVLSNDLAASTVCDSGANNFTSPSKGTLVLSQDKKSFTYTPSPNSVGPDSFTYKTCNPNGSSSFATASITINPNQPQALPDTTTIPESTPSTVDVLANDINATNICPGSIMFTNQGSSPSPTSPNGTANIVTTGSGSSIVTKILFTPTSGYIGNITLTYTACSSLSGTSPSSPATVTITVTPVPPVAVNDTATTRQNNPVTINVLANDSDPSGQALTICMPLSSVSGGNGTIAKTVIGAVEQIIFTPTPGFAGSASFSYAACEGVGNPSTLATVNVTVVPNLPPIANPDSASTVSNFPVVINLPANDTDTDGFLDLTSVTIVAAPAKGNVSVDPTTGKATYVASTNLFTTNGTDSFTYKIKDNQGSYSNAATVIVSVTVDPVANSDAGSGLVFSPLVLNVAANDTATSAPLDLGTVTIVTPPTKGTLSVNNTVGSPDLGKVTYTPTSSSYPSSDTDSFTYKIKDTEGHISNVATATVNIAVPPANQLPVANNDTASGGKYSVLLIDVAANDTFSGGTLDRSSVTIVTPPTKGTVSVDNTVGSPDLGKVTYTPASSSFTQSGTDSFTYKIKDNQGGYSNTATVNITVTLLLPVATNDNATLNINVPTTIDVLANDTLATSICDGSLFSTSSGSTGGTGSTTPTASQSSAGGTLIIVNGKIVYTPATNFTGTDSFVYKACNSDGESNSTSVNLTVNALPVVTQNVQLTLYKEKQDIDIVLNQPVKIQADIKNPNNFVVSKIETVINIDTTKLDFVPNSQRQGSIVGLKYLSFLEQSNNLASLFSLAVNAQTSTVTPPATTANTTIPTVSFQGLSSSSLKIIILNAGAGQTIPIVFDVLPKASLQNSIQGTADIINLATNQSIATASASIKITPVTPLPQVITATNVLVRTGGLPVLQLSIGLLMAMAYALYQGARKRWGTVG